MLRGIDPIVSPELLDVLFRMGHGDEIVLADAFFPGDTFGKRVVRADGIGIARLLEGILPLITLDSYVDSPLIMMAPVEGDLLDKSVETSYRKSVDHIWPDTAAVKRMDRFPFYDRAKEAYAVVMTGETSKYGNIILKKGVINR